MFPGVHSRSETLPSPDPIGVGILDYLPADTEIIFKIRSVQSFDQQRADLAGTAFFGKRDLLPGY